MPYDLILRGGRVVDGTGMPGYIADVAIENGRIARIGRIQEEARKVIDCDGAVVAPGFIDVHTHYDVQLDWDPLASPSCFHGVTTVLTGNCGFTLAPAKPEDVGWLAAMLSRVEGMSKQALAEGFEFSGGSFGEFWDRLEGKLGINAAGYVGHCAVRRWVMGDDASERKATQEEIVAMQQLVRESMEQGAIGFSTSQLELHVGDDGREVPCNHASAEEILALASVLSEFDHGAIEIIPRSMSEGYDEKDRKLLKDLYEVSGKPVELNILSPTPAHPMGWQSTLEFCREASAEGIRLHPQFTTNRLELHLRLSDTFVFDEMPLWREVLTRPEPERCQRMRDSETREALRAEWENPDVRAVAFEIGDLIVEAVTRSENEAHIGRSVAQIAEDRGADPFDTFLDLALSEDLLMVFQSGSPEIARDFIKMVVETGVKDPIVMAGSSDGGAHLASFTGADYSTRLLSEWVPESMSLEQAIWRLAGMPATVHGLKDRGFLRHGAWADIVIFDPGRLRAGDAYLARDFPAQTERYVVDSEGYRYLIVAGQVVLEDGKPTDARPGQVIRGA